MEELSPVPTKDIDPNRFKQLVADLKAVLPWVTQETLGNAMGIKRSDINRYLIGRLPITKNFLNKFYESWGDRLPPPEKNREPSLTEIMTVLQRIESKIDMRENP
jgi:hypothetical protein